ncbi:hypothetical protein HAPAU_30880 [Halalkalicoccus paucihalophilus]|uniref:Uncharacterized protein n=1 Tax=Halalkalicoccus paucihalophilus TaxID=1008153 RepID=A0A151AB36_9EURY|nr:hypothetical protein [Halalkalicoccus paucihalophilus]KYH24712.1 hypothetical protein HAPAU_30880 [Halalkalicoccus paucihalophilus]
MVGKSSEDGVDYQQWSEQYNANYDPALKEIEGTLTTALGEQHYMTQGQLEKVIQWKLNVQRGRRDRSIEWMSDVPAAFIQRISEAAFLVDDPKLQLNTLTSIPGIGPATATVVLTFHDPTTYVVGDRYMVTALFDEDRALCLSDYPRLFTELRERNPGGFDLRTIETASYQQYRETYAVDRW